MFDIHLRDGYFQDEIAKCGKSTECKSCSVQRCVFNTAALFWWKWIPRTTDGPVLKFQQRKPNTSDFFKKYLPLATSMSLFSLFEWLCSHLHPPIGALPSTQRPHHKANAKCSLMVSRSQSPSNSPSSDSGARSKAVLSWWCLFLKKRYKQEFLHSFISKSSTRKSIQEKSSLKTNCIES